MKKSKISQLEVIAEDRFYKLLAMTPENSNIPLELRRLALAYFKAGFANGIRFLGNNSDFFAEEIQDLGDIGEL